MLCKLGSLMQKYNLQIYNPSAVAGESLCLIVRVVHLASAFAVCRGALLGVLSDNFLTSSGAYQEVCWNQGAVDSHWTH